MMKLAIAILLATLCNTQTILAQSKPPLEYQIKAAFLFNFTRFIHWPATAYTANDAPFVIGIIGNDPFGTYLDDIVKGEEVDGHRIIVRRYRDVADVMDCQLLFVSSADPVRLKEILLPIVKQNILTVGDAERFIDAGGIVRFFKEQNRIKMEVKLAAAKSAQLEISAKLLKVALVN